jgi:hypothetical protein
MFLSDKDEARRRSARNFPSFPGTIYQSLASSRIVDRFCQPLGSFSLRTKTIHHYATSFSEEAEANAIVPLQA